MRSQLRMRHYCDFCKKSGGTKPAMERHERGCTGNPDRHCRMCEIRGNVHHPMPELIAAVGNGDRDGMTRLRELTDDCPACILATLRQSKELAPCFPMNPFGLGDEERGTYMEFRFEEEQKEFWREHNANNPRNVGY